MYLHLLLYLYIYTPRVGILTACTVCPVTVVQFIFVHFSLTNWVNFPQKGREEGKRREEGIKNYMIGDEARFDK